MIDMILEFLHNTLKMLSISFIIVLIDSQLLTNPSMTYFSISTFLELI